MIVRDIMQGKMLVFDAETFDFIEEYFPEIEALHFCLLNEKNDMAWYNTMDVIHKNKTYPYHIVTTKRDDSFISKMIPADFSSGYILRPYTPFFQTDTSTLFSHPYQGSVYRIFADKEEEMVKINFQHHPFPPNNYLIGTGNNDNFVPSMRQSDYINYFETFESPQHYSFNLFAANTYFMVLHHKASNKSIYFPVSIVENNTIKHVVNDDIGMLYFNIPITCVDDSYYSLILPTQLMDSKKNHAGDIHPQLQKVIDNIKEEDNPVILRYKINFK